MMRLLMSVGSIAILMGVVQAAEPPPDAPPPPDSSTRAQIEQQMQHAQEQMERAAREMADLGRRLGDEAWAEMPQGTDFGMSRVMLGIHIESDHGTTTDGVRILSISPGGPADTAGLKANDVITSFNGSSLRDASKGSPQHQLLELMREAKADVAVAVEFRREAKVQTAQVVPKSLSQFVADSMSHEFAGIRGDFDEHRPFAGRGGPSAFGSAELAELSPGLGHYFGTDKGLLVVRAPKDDRLKLQDGDVMLDIDGRIPTSVSHAYQILSSYRPGETLKLHVMRQQKRLELTVQIPAPPEREMDSEHGVRADPRGPERRTEL